MATTKKSHWENIYTTKAPNQVSWTQEKPIEGLEYLNKSGLSKDAKIIDIGGGDSLFVDSLLALNYTNVTVLDISEAAINRAKLRLGDRANNVTWVVSDILDFKPDQTYDFWYDRAVFHFLIDKTEIQQYINLTKQAIEQHLIIGTFSTNGPLKCSGLEISQYSEASLFHLFSGDYKLLNSKLINHKTPFDTIQNFVFCHMTKK